MAGTMLGRGQEVRLLVVGKEKKAEANTPSEGLLVKAVCGEQRKDDFKRILGCQPTEKQ